MAWCEGQTDVLYCLGLAKNSVLVERLGPALATAQMRWCLCGAANVWEFAEFAYQTVRSWSRARRVIGNAEVAAQGFNPRFVVSNLPADGFQGDEDKTRFTPARLYEELYCARGEMENVLKQQTLDLQADRLSTHYLASNQLRLWLSALAYLLLERVRTLGLAGTELAQATGGSIRLKLLKVAARVRVSVRRVYVQLSTRLSVADPVPVVPAAAHGAGPGQRLTPVIHSASNFHAGGVSKKGAHRLTSPLQTRRPTRNPLRHKAHAIEIIGGLVGGVGHHQQATRAGRIGG